MKTNTPISLVYLGNKNRDVVEPILQQLPADWRYRKTDLSAVREPGLVVVDEEVENKSAQIADWNRQGWAVLALTAKGEEPLAEIQERLLYLDAPVIASRLLQAMEVLAVQIRLGQQLRCLQEELDLRSQELAELNKIGVALSAERDSNKLLELILSKAREITAADAGSLYLIEKSANSVNPGNDPWADKQLRFKLAQNDSLKVDYQEFVLPIQRKSMAGYTVLSGKPLNISDAYHLPAESEFEHNRSFDERTGYHTQSVLCIPMMSHQAELIGVLQLINRKKNRVRLSRPEVIQEQVMAFDDRCVELASSLASQAAVSIENMRLYEDIKRLFEGFILASVHAIEQRDPTTSGHSERVAVLTVAMAEQVDRLNRGSFHDVHFTRDDLQQIKYAALLHDFGKIGVRENVLVKAKKLYPEQLEMIKLRFQYIKKLLEAKTSREKIAFLLSQDIHQVRTILGSLDDRFFQQLRDLDGMLDFILQANEPRVLPENGWSRLDDLGHKVIEDDDSTTPLLNQDEVLLLSISRGSLSAEERNEIESHVTHTFNFLSRIPWAPHLRQVPYIAYAHHEKLDGSGYPRKLPGEQIPLPSKIMTIADIYDALTAWDRPYKRAVPSEKALAILQEEVNAGKIDAELFDLFVQAEIFKLVNRTDS